MGRASWGFGTGAVLLAGVLVAPSMAHEAPGGSPSPSPGVSEAASGGLPRTRASSARETEVTINMRDAVLTHLHNKIVHFPLAVGLTAALFLVVSRRWPQYWPAARLLLLLAALGAAAAYFSGQAQAEDFEGGPLREWLERHESLGEASGIALWLGLAAAFLPNARRWMWVYALLLAALLSATGFLGGILSHSAF
jgi:uncharacterized membrane protein